VTSLELRGVTHKFDDKTVVDNVSLRLETGEILCLLGPSGCGKTTTLRIAAGLEELQQGTVLIDNQVVADGSAYVPPEQRGIGLVFQDYALFPHLRVIDNVAFGVENGNTEAKRRRAMDMLERVGMSQYAYDYPHMLSGGEQQRVALARALAPGPGVMLMDEPFSGLDVRLRDQVRDDTLALLKEIDTATLLVTHDPEEAMRMADRIVLMRDGRVVQEGTPVELYNRPSDAFVARFFSETNELAGRVVNDTVATPFGDLPANGLENGSDVVVLIRPEALIPNKGGAETKLLSSRVLGAYTLVRFVVAESGTQMTARVPGVLEILPESINVGVDRSQCFVFPISRSG
jgi:iron(III) transport system ATP-binding protein